ncbi:MAG TPA: chromate transporter [Sphaerochaeta sp.]|nr:chromate transporter [Sphaerochaeta sp.]
MTMKTEKTTLWELYISFLKIGGLTFGGGLAMLPMLQREVVTKHKWVNEEELLDIYAIGQVTPGIIAINAASLIGYKRRGIIGSVVATLGEITPSLVLITLLASILTQFQENALVQHAFGGIRVAVCALIAQSVMTLYKKSIVDLPTLLLCLITVIGTLFFQLSPIVFVIAGILFGLGVQKLKRRKAE